MISSPIVLMTVPWCCSVAVRITSMQIETISRARTSPSDSYSRVEPTTSAKTMASSMSFPMRLVQRKARGGAYGGTTALGEIIRDWHTAGSAHQAHADAHRLPG